MKTDTDLQRDVRDELVWEPGVKAHGIVTEAQNGKVTLRGMVELHFCAFVIFLLHGFIKVLQSSIQGV